jgi:hypothetical protein
VIVIASDGMAFDNDFGVAPTYTIAATGSGTPMIEIVPPEAPVLENKLTDEGEIVVLFEWDGVGDRVRDVDIVVHGMPTAANQLIAKQPVDGPDADAEATDYAVDALTSAMVATGPNDETFSYKRFALEATHETSEGGNGITGHDETSENLELTWDTGSAPPTPGILIGR